MSALEAMVTNLQSEMVGSFRFVSRMNGSAQSMLVKDDLERLWVLKFQSDLQGPNSLANELVGSLLCKSLGIPVPDFTVVKLDAKFCNDKRVWLSTPVGFRSAAPGLHFASRYLPQQNRQIYMESLPITFDDSIVNLHDCLGVFVFDTWALHADNRQALFNFSQDGFRATFFDHGHLFGGPAGAAHKPLTNGHLIQRLALREATAAHKNQWIVHMQAMIPDALEQALQKVPLEWLGDTFRLLPALFLRRLDHLQSFIDLALASIQHSIKEQSCKPEAICNDHVQALLPSGIRIHLSGADGSGIRSSADALSLITGIE